MITDERIENALHSVANDHDVKKAVKALLARAYDEGVSAAFMHATTENYRWYGQPDEGLPNPYDETEARDGQ